MNREVRQIQSVTQPAMISVVIPLWNEEDCVDELITRLREATAELPAEFEFIVVDDGSTDGTLEKLNKWRQTDERLAIIKLSRNWGHQNACSAGIDIAKGDAAILMDGDLEDPPEFIPKLLAEWFNGYDVVYTVKQSRYQTHFRRLLTNCYYRLMGVSADHYADYQAGIFSLIDKKVLDAIRGLKEKRRSYPTFRSFAGFRQKKLVYSREARAHGQSKQTLPRLVSDGLNAFFSNTYLPIRMFTVFGILISVLFFVLGAIVVFVKLTGIEFWVFRDIPGTQLIILLLLFVASFQFIFLGVLGEYIARIYDETKNRPYYIIDEILRDDINNS
jgi:dolichol-phosphate mannosyltransferase